MANRNSAKINDGSLSDTQTYAEVKPEFSTYAMWLKHNSPNANRLSEGDSLESVASPGLNRNSKLLQSRETTPTAQQGQNSRLNRSNSIRYALTSIFFENDSSF
jgi:neuron navigator 2